MTIESYFFNAIQHGGVYDRVYNAQDITDYLDGIVGNGIFPNPSTNLQVIASRGMQVIVKAGKGWINGHKMVNTSDLPIDVDISDVALNRIDRVVFFVDKTERIMGIRVKKGVSAIQPIAPELVRNKEVVEYGLATITVGKQITDITQEMITDTRLDDTVCGVIAGLIKQVGTETLFIQYQNAFESDRKNNQDEFDEWFKHVKETLSTGTLIREFKNTVIITEQDQTVFDIDVPQFLYETDILEVYVNGFRLTSDEFTYTQEQVTLVKGLDKSTDDLQNIIEFIVYKSVDGSEAETIVEQVEKLQDRVVELENMINAFILQYDGIDIK